MARAYKLPDLLPGEGNWEWCKRAADAIPAEEIVRALVQRLKEKKPKRGRPAREPWSYIGDLLGHGSGVSSAIVEKYSR